MAVVGQEGEADAAAALADELFGEAVDLAEVAEDSLASALGGQAGSADAVHDGGSLVFAAEGIVHAAEFLLEYLRGAEVSEGVGGEGAAVIEAAGPVGVGAAEIGLVSGDEALGGAVEVLGFVGEGLPAAEDFPEGQISHAGKGADEAGGGVKEAKAALTVKGINQFKGDAVQGDDEVGQVGGVDLIERDAVGE